MMQNLESEVIELKKFIVQINSSEKSAIIVEGKNDVEALRKIGVLGRIIEFHKFHSMNEFADKIAKYKEVILLFDWDHKGRYLTRRVIKLLERRTKINLTEKKKLHKITRGKIKFVEQLVNYESDLRPDAFLIKCF